MFVLITGSMVSLYFGADARHQANAAKYFAADAERQAAKARERARPCDGCERREASAAVHI